MERYLERHDLVQDVEEDEEEDDLEEGAIIGESFVWSTWMKALIQGSKKSIMYLEG